MNWQRYLVEQGRPSHVVLGCQTVIGIYYLSDLEGIKARSCANHHSSQVQRQLAEEFHIS